MLNKKMLAVSIAAGLVSANAFATFDLDNTPSNKDPLVYATESLTQSNIDQGAIVVTTTGAVNALDASFSIKPFQGSQLPQVSYVRVDIGNATFNKQVEIDNLEASSVSGNLVVSDVIGGSASSSTVIFEVQTNDGGTPTAPLGVDEELLANFNLDHNSLGLITPVDGSAVTVKISGYTTDTAASAGSNALSTSRVQPIASFGSAFEGSFTGTPAAITATFASEFKNFAANNGATKLVAPLVSIDPSELFDTDKVYSKLDSSTVALSDFVALLPSTNYTLQVNGDLSFGEVTLHTGTNGCADGSVEIPESGSIALSRNALVGATNATPPAPTGTAEHTVCITVDGDTVIPRGSYTASLTVPEAAQGGTAPNVAGTYTDAGNAIIYDTKSYSIPYLSTFGEYNQRLIITNKSGNDAEYFMTFTSEGVTTATPLEDARGIVKAGEMLVLRAADLVELEGRTRTSATLEIGSSAATTQVATQTVNTETGGTDTVFIDASNQ